MILKGFACFCRRGHTPKCIVNEGGDGVFGQGGDVIENHG